MADDSTRRAEHGGRGRWRIAVRPRRAAPHGERVWANYWDRVS